jgi:hypothetical protein
MAGFSVTGYRLPTTGYRLPATGYRRPDIRRGGLFCFACGYAGLRRLPLDSAGRGDYHVSTAGLRAVANW